MTWGSSWDDKSKVIIGLDQGSPDGDKTVVSLHDGKTLNVIGESVHLEIPINAWVNKTVDAIQVGDLAVHKALNAEEDYCWQVTHVPTLTMFDRAIPEGDWTQDQLIKWCWKVQLNQPLFGPLSNYNNQTYRDISPNYLEAVCKHCLSIGVE